MNDNLNRYGQRNRSTKDEVIRIQPCPECGHPMGDMPGSRDVICPNRGYKDPCCE